MPKKKQPQGAFQLFMNDWKNQHKDECDVARASQSEILRMCEADWKSSPDAQNYYKTLAAQAKGKAKLQVEFKYTCTGETYEQKEAERREEQAFIDNMIIEIKSTVNDLSSAGIEALVNYRFYLIHANYYIEWTTEKKFIPCEVAIAEYSITHGVLDVLHFFPAVDTPDGNLPLGYAFEATDKADATHQIPCPPFELAEYDFNDLSSRVIAFLTKYGSEIPPVYTMNDDVNCNYSRSTVCDFMDIVHDFSGKAIKVYRLPLLFYELYKACTKLGKGSKEPVLTEAAVEEKMSVDPFLYVQGISCTFHECLNSSAYRFCSKSTVQRWGYILCGECSKEAGIELLPGIHRPDTWNESNSINIKKVPFSRRTRTTSVSSCASSASERSKVLPKNEKAVISRPDPQSTPATVVKLGKEAGVYSEIRQDEVHPLVEGSGVRVPKTIGKCEMIVMKRRNEPLRGFTKDDFPDLGRRRGERGKR